MININGQDFESIEQAIAHLNEVKEKEEKEAQEKRKEECLQALNSAVADFMVVHLVEIDSTYYLVCSLADTRDPMYGCAVIQRIFGNQYSINGIEVTKHYSYSRISNPPVKLREFVVDSIKSGEGRHIRSKNFEFQGKSIEAVYISDFTKEGLASLCRGSSFSHYDSLDAFIRAMLGF